MNINKFSVYSNPNVKFPKPISSQNAKLQSNQTTTKIKNKTDLIEISHSSVKETTPASIFAQIRNRVASELREPTDPQRLADLKEQIENGEYNLNSHDIAKSILY